MRLAGRLPEEITEQVTHEPNISLNRSAERPCRSNRGVLVAAGYLRSWPSFANISHHYGGSRMAVDEEMTDGFLVKLITTLAPDSKAIEKWVSEIRRENPDLDSDSLAEYIGDYLIWAYAKQGAALALPGAIPGLGTLVQVATEVGACSVDVALMVRNQTYLVFALGHCYGFEARQALIQDTLLCMGLWTNALSLTKSGAVRIGTKIAEANFKKRFPAKILQVVNRKVGTTIVTKYGVKRGGVAVGKLIPFGVGVVVGGGFNYITMKRFNSSTRGYFTLKAGGR